MKTQLEKFSRQFITLGTAVVDRGSDLQASVQQINYETDLRIFIDANKSNGPCPDRFEYKPYEPSADVTRQKAALIAKINQ